MTRDRLETEPSRREAAKAERRQRIVNAAKSLIRETGKNGLSMRALAKRADVSLVTPYNLFGSKQAIVLALLDDIYDFFDEFESDRPADPLDALFAAINMIVSLYVDDEQFYRTLWAVVFDSTNEVPQDVYDPKRDKFWIGILKELESNGGFEDLVDNVVLMYQLHYQFRSVMMDWVMNDISYPALAPALRMGVGIVLRGVANPELRERLRVHIKADYEMMSRLPRKANPLMVLPTAGK